LPLNFPDICNGMRLTVWPPRGGFGANPVPRIIQENFAGYWKTQYGGFPYSEGIWDDLDKALVAGLYWDSDSNVFDVMKEYISFEFSPDVVNDVTEAIRILEKNSKVSKSYAGSDEFGVKKTELNKERVPVDSLEALKLMEKADGVLTEQAKKSWRWRLLYLRALIDAELHKTNGKLEGKALRAAFDELRDIYQYKEKPRYVGVPMQDWQ